MIKLIRRKDYWAEVHIFTLPAIGENATAMFSLLPIAWRMQPLALQLGQKH
jgi:hypothetical protein